MSDPFNPGSRNNQIQAYKGNFVDKFVPRDELIRPSLAHKNRANEFTKQRIDEIVDQKTFISQRAMAAQVQSRPDAEYVKYTSKADPTSVKLVQIQEVPEDPLAPAQFKVKRIPQGPGSPPRTILRSPPRALTEEDQKNWRIPPCTSNWKNKKGFIVPLEMRLAADGRSANPPTINENFAKFTAALYASEKAVRKELEEKERIKQQLAMEDLKRAEDQIREKANLARQRRDQLFNEGNMSARAGTQADFISRFDDNEKEMDEAERKRNEIRALIRRENVRNLRMENMGNRQRAEAKERERDLAERVALGEEIGGGRDGEVGVDHRLLNQEKGLNAGHLDEDQDDIYDKPLFREQERVNLYSYKDVDAQMEEGGYFESLRNRRGDKKRGTEEAGLKRRAFEPVQFQKDDTGISAKRLKKE